ncbi:cyclin 7, putative [Trypanosoma equiperdum]|uniref:Cyclin n=2 Tax=Trypanozoon TaxID=39700 RepID=Q586H4_TRYB2|nr:cyclin 7, putative [Trypanosoma brucei brucei TREU927]AAX80280.1 cyclin 7, putative [Trypanosoma brucei]AAZ12060.1 cyclin 7, putative [Trypanosoma brucei brucei TREU927]SCU66667.1 cyclin 7, putative [Trypanosoma equiperdum]
MSERDKQRRSLERERMATVIFSYISHLMRTHEEETTVADEFIPSTKFFRTETLPNISLIHYVRRVVEHMNCSPEAYIFALAYIRRLFVAGFPLHTHSIYRLLLTAVVVATRVRDDFLFSKKYYSKVGGVTACDLNMMEIHFLADLLEYRVEVSPDEYRVLCNEITALLSSEVSKFDGNSSNPNNDTAAEGVASIQEPVGNSKPRWMSECCLYW